MIIATLLAFCLSTPLDAATAIEAAPPTASVAEGTSPNVAALENTAADQPYEGAVDVFRFTFENPEDRNFDAQPDEWTRRKGPGFPAYIDGTIDRRSGHGGSTQSLRFKANGGRIIMYSKAIPVDPFHSFVFRGYIRTQLLDQDAALVSISFLNHKRQRVQRYLTRPVTGTFKEWHEVTVGPVVPHEDVHFVVIGCHLVPGGRIDIRGSAWFDDLWLGQLPLYSLESNFQSHFRAHDSRVVITSQVDGLDPKHAYRLDMQMVDASGKPVASTSFDLAKKQAEPSPSAPAIPAGPDPVKKKTPIDWNLDPQPHGFYAVESTLMRDGKPLLTKRTSFAVMDSLSEAAEQGEFGWTVRRPEEMPSLRELAEIASQAGINWLKYPLWRSVDDANSNAATAITVFFDELTQRRITPVGLLNDPPADLRAQFGRDWTGINEVFTMRTEFWRESIERVIARYSSHVRHWQLGEEEDASFVGMSSRSLAETLARVKSEFDRIGRDTRIGIHWTWETPLPNQSDIRGTFFSVTCKEPFKDNELSRKLHQIAAGSPERWIVLKPLPKAGFTPEERGSDLVKKMVEAKIGGAQKIFVDDVFDAETGLLNPGGSPSLLFLPWRTTAMALRGAEFIGSLLLPGGSRNFAFSQNGEVAIVAWNNEPADEDLFLSEDSIVTDCLGRRIALPPSRRGRTNLRMGPSPLIIRHFSEPAARWMTSLAFEKGRLPSKTGKQKETIRGLNTFNQGVSGQLKILVPKDWKVNPPEVRFSLAAGEKFEWPITLELPSNTSLGNQRIILDFAMSPYQFRVYRDYEVGLGDVVLSVVETKLSNGDLQVKQVIDNHTNPEEQLNFECNLYAPSRRRMQKSVIKLKHGKDTQVYLVPDAESLRGKELQIRAQQVGGQRVLNLRWKVGENWDAKKNPRGLEGRAAGRPLPAADDPTDRPAAEPDRS